MYPITVVINDAGGSMTTDTGSTTVADAPLTAGTITAAGGVEYTTATTLTAKFTDANANAPTSDFSGTINWGDGAPGSPDITTFTSSAVTGSAGSYSVSGSHQYAEDGMYPITVVINDTGGSVTTDTGSATVADAPLTGSSSAAATGGVAGVTAATLANATFSDANLNAPSSDFTVTAVAWGDGGTSTAGLTVSGSNGSYSVNGSHLYTASGTFSFSITVTDDGGQTATITGSATVAAASEPDQQRRGRRHHRCLRDLHRVREQQPGREHGYDHHGRPDRLPGRPGGDDHRRRGVRRPAWRVRPTLTTTSFTAEPTRIRPSTSTIRRRSRSRPSAILSAGHTRSAMSTPPAALAAGTGGQATEVSWQVASATLSITGSGSHRITTVAVTTVHAARLLCRRTGEHCQCRHGLRRRLDDRQLARADEHDVQLHLYDEPGPVRAPATER